MPILPEELRKRKTAQKPKKPYAKFPLTPHPSGAWQKKIRGRIHYFGRWGRIRNGKMERLPGDGWQEALALYQAQADDLHSGRTPRPKTETSETTVADICNHFLTAKLRKMQSDELSPRSLAEYRQTTDRLTSFFGNARLVDDLLPEDFARLRYKIAETCGPVRISNELTRIKSVFKSAVQDQLINSEPNYGSQFKKPDKRVLRRHKATSDKKLFASGELQSLLKEANEALQAITLLGVNCGLGNTDISNLELRNLDLEAGWLDYPRGKTGIQRRIPLWPETVSALTKAIAARPEPKHEDDSTCVFLSERGERFVRITEKSRTDGVSKQFGKLLRTLSINGRRGLGFYSLRHTFATVALQTGDRDAVKALMGHAENDILSHYDETGPSSERLVAVTNHVRMWLFGAEIGGDE